MRFPNLRWIVIVALMATTLVSVGCAKKKPPATPEPPPAPAVTPPPTPPPAPPDTTRETLPPPSFSASDFQPAFFDFDSYTLRDDARTALDADAKLLRDHADANVTIEGHCDERGTSEYNQALGEKRAQAARDYLVAAGISASRLQTISYGKERPFDPGHDEAAWAKNRRANFALR